MLTWDEPRPKPRKKQLEPPGSSGRLTPMGDNGAPERESSGATEVYRLKWQERRAKYLRETGRAEPLPKAKTKGAGA